MNEKETKTAVLDEQLVREIISEGEDVAEGEARVVRVPRDSLPAGDADGGSDDETQA
jgi:hypothetical protein